MAADQNAFAPTLLSGRYCSSSSTPLLAHTRAQPHQMAHLLRRLVLLLLLACAAIIPVAGQGGRGTSVFTGVPLSDIQGTCDGAECEASPYSGQTVTVAGTVVATVDAGFFLNDDSGYGVYVYEHSFHPVIGDLVQLSAQVSEYHDLTELSRVADPVVLSSGNLLPRPMAVATGELGERHEGLLVSVQAVSAPPPLACRPACLPSVDLDHHLHFRVEHRRRALCMISVTASLSSTTAPVRR